MSENHHHKAIERLVDSVTNVVGSWWFFGVHFVWFGWWLIALEDVDWLTLIVSLEAILLMIVLLMSDNRQNIRDRRKADQDLNADLSAVKMDIEILKRLDVIEKQIALLKPPSPKK